MHRTREQGPPPIPRLGERVASVDGLRGLAALAVVTFHVTYFLGALPYATLGGMGVLMFFVLSGYLITEGCWRRDPTAAAYRRFVARRVRRLGPVAFGLALVGAPLLVLAGHVPAQQALRDAATVVAQSTGVAMTAGVDTFVAFQPTWSLTVEWAFYLTLPVVLSVLRRRGVGAVGATRAFAGVALGLYLVGLFLPDLLFYLAPVADLGALYAGAALATWHRSLGTSTRAVDPARTALWLTLLAVYLVLPGSPLGVAWKLVVFPTTVVATLVVLHACRFGNRVSDLLAVRPLRLVGRTSYSLYLWHVPVLWVVWVQTPGLAPWPQVGLASVAIAGVTALSFVVLERPVLRAREPDVGRGTLLTWRRGRAPEPSEGVQAAA